MRKAIHWAAREKRRAVNSAIGNSFLKTITEPLTNSDSNLKTQANVPHAAGLVEKVLALQPGDILNTAQLKTQIQKAKVQRRILLEIVTAGAKARTCRIVDAGTGMSLSELENKFTRYAEAKALGQRTRSLFGRGALDVLLYHEQSIIYSVKEGLLASARFYWDHKKGEPICELKNLGKPTKRLLTSNGLPLEILDHGTVVQFRLREGTHIPQEEQMLAKISEFYMLRLIAADPNTEVRLRRRGSQGEKSWSLNYDFPVGKVLLRARDTLNLDDLGNLPVDILVCRSDVPLATDSASVERRQNGLLFVEDNDAVLDLTLLPEYDKSPYLKRVYGLVRITGLRSVLEARLEATEAEAALTISRDGFDRKSWVTQRLFSLVERHVAPVYHAEEKAEKSGNAQRSEQLHKRVNDALKALNQFNANETDEEGEAPTRKDNQDAIYFAVESARLSVGQPRRITAFIDLKKIRHGEVVLFESDSGDFKVAPDSEVVKGRKNQSHQAIPVTIQCDRKGAKGTITALTLNNSGEEVSASLRILGVDEAPIFAPPEDIEFVSYSIVGEPNRPTNATLLINLEAFEGMPGIRFNLTDIIGNVSLNDGRTSITVQVEPKHVLEGRRVARFAVRFVASGWGQSALLWAHCERRDGTPVSAKCKLVFERPKGDDKFSNFHYEDLGRPVLGDVAGDKIYVNAGCPLHRQIFGEDEQTFNQRLETDPIAQSRAASVLVETIVFHTATTKHHAGGKKGLHIPPEDPIGSLRPYLDESKIRLEPKVFQALVTQRE